MTQSLHIARLSFMALALLALPLSAQVGRHRAVAHPGNKDGNVNVSGVVTNASGGAPISGAIIHFGERTSNVTGSDGKYTVSLPSGSNITLSAEQFAFGTQQKAITVAAGLTVDFSLSAKPLTAIKLKSGETKNVVYDTAQFAFLVPFSGYIRSNQANLCKPDGSAFTPDRLDIAHITGPIGEVTFAKCCEKVPVIAATFQMKSGESTVAYFVDSCFGNDVVFLGRDPNGGAFTYVSFKDIAQVDMP
jgi:hypothetical protein